MSRYVWVDDPEHNDYYAGDQGALYRDGALIWDGYSADIGYDLAHAIIGDDLERALGHSLPVRDWRKDGSQWAERLDDIRGLRMAHPDPQNTRDATLEFIRESHPPA